MSNTYQNPPGSPDQRKLKIKDLYRFIKTRIKDRGLQLDIPASYITPKDQCKEDIFKKQDTVTWLGHSCFILNFKGIRILTDPYLTDYASPIPKLGPKRSVQPPLAIEELPPFDFIVISHNHYDHLDVRALRRIPNKERIRVIVPMGLIPLIKKQGFSNVVEMNWHESRIIQDVKFTCLPAVHYSSRGLFDRNKTLWAGFKIESVEGYSVFFAGDTAYGEVFKTLQENGPYDLGLLPIGAYEPQDVLKYSHTTPEEAVQIALDMGIKNITPMHWGTVILSNEPFFEPIERFKLKATQHFEEKNILTFNIGETKPLPNHLKK